jgi:hypothetical protein
MQMPKPKEPKTHFEQVPLEIVKEVAAEDIEEGKTGRPDVPAKPPAIKRGAFRAFNPHSQNAL